MPRYEAVTTLKELAKQKIEGMTIGIDLGDHRSHFCVLNDEGQVIARGFLPTTITAFRREFEVLPPSLIAIEASTHSFWANQVLKVCGHNVVVGNPRKIRLIGRVIARMIALMLRLWRDWRVPTVGCFLPFTIAPRTSN